MRLAHIVDGVVVNVIEAAARPEWASDWPATDEAGIGWLYDGGFSAPIPTQDQIAAALAAERAGMSCTAMQGKLALGPDRWAVVEAYRDDPATTWAERIIIDSAGQWARMSENIAFFAYLLNLSDTEVDDLFRAARGIDA